MKKIALLPVKNEADILTVTLPLLTTICDSVIIADQFSTDATKAVCKQFPNVIVIDNKETDGHSNKVRWQLLDAARDFSGENLLILTDADEFIPPALFHNWFASADLLPGTAYRLPWIQLWRSLEKYNDSGVWHNNFQSALFVDDRKVDYERKRVVNDHTSRVPSGLELLELAHLPLLHLQWVYWERTQYKQAWYRCMEFLDRPTDPRGINNQYSISLIDPPDSSLKTTPSEWISNLPASSVIESLPVSWHQVAILDLFAQHGIAFFEPLQIWHLAVLEAEFVKQLGRKPFPKIDKHFKIKSAIKQFLPESVLYSVQKIRRYKRQ